MLSECVLVAIGVAAYIHLRFHAKMAKFIRISLELHLTPHSRLV